MRAGVGAPRRICAAPLTICAAARRGAPWCADHSDRCKTYTKLKVLMRPFKQEVGRGEPTTHWATRGVKSYKNKIKKLFFYFFYLSNFDGFLLRILSRGLKFGLKVVLELLYQTNIMILNCNPFLIRTALCDATRAPQRRCSRRKFVNFERCSWAPRLEYRPSFFTRLFS